MRAVALTGFALLMFAANSLLCRMALHGGSVDAASFSTIRLASGTVMLLLLLRLRTGGGPVCGDWRSAFWLFLYALPFSFAYLGLTTGTGALILFGMVQLTMLVAAWWSGERPSAMQWTGVLLAAGGLVYLLLPGLMAPPLREALLMAVAGVAWGLYSLRGRRSGDAIARNAGNFLRTLPMALLVLLLVWSDIRIDAQGVALAIASGAVASAIGYAAWYAALRDLSAMHASVVQLTVPVIAAMLGVLLLSEVMTLRLVIASVLVLGGAGLTRPWRS
jgi:drug/metabolite transporter (DMT)-like permease